jgi:hypothetical protein
MMTAFLLGIGVGVALTLLVILIVGYTEQRRCEQRLRRLVGEPGSEQRERWERVIRASWKP